MSVTINMKDNVAQLQRTPLYGLLYNHIAIADFKNDGHAFERTIAPIGWHIATSYDFDTLCTFLGGRTDAGIKLKEEGYDHWAFAKFGMGAGTNESGFTALPSGFRKYDGTFLDKSLYIYMAGITRWLENFWEYTTIPYNSGVVTTYTASYNALGMYVTNGFSVRCVRDTSDGWIEGETVTDYDGNLYHTIQIGTQIWMVENLAVTHFNNGDPISEITDNTEWDNCTNTVPFTPALCAYNNDWSGVFKS